MIIYCSHIGSLSLMQVFFISLATVSKGSIVFFIVTAIAKSSDDLKNLLKSIERYWREICAFSSGLPEYVRTIYFFCCMDSKSCNFLHPFHYIIIKQKEYSFSF